MKKGIIAVASALVILTACRGEPVNTDSEASASSAISEQMSSSEKAEASEHEKQAETPTKTGEFNPIYDYANRLIHEKMPELRLNGFQKHARIAEHSDEAALCLEIVGDKSKEAASYSLSYEMTKPYTGEPVRDDGFYTTYKTLFDAAMKLSGVDTDALRAELSPVRNTALFKEKSEGYSHEIDKRWAFSGRLYKADKITSETLRYKAQVSPNVGGEGEEALEMINGLSEDWKAAFDQAKMLTRTITYADNSGSQNKTPVLHKSARVSAVTVIDGDKPEEHRMVTLRVEGDQGVLIDKYKIALSQMVVKLGDEVRKGKTDMDREIMAAIGRKAPAEAPKRIDNEWYRFEVYGGDIAKSVGDRAYYELSYIADDQGMPISTTVFTQNH